MKINFRKLTEAANELVEDYINEASIKHMTAGEKMKAKKYRMSATGKKALAKYLKKASKAGYKVDPQKSKTAKKVAALRKEDIDEWDIDNLTEEQLDEIIGLFSEEELEAFDALFEACQKKVESDSEDDEDDAEDDINEAIKHMTAAEKAEAKKYRMSASGKKALAKYTKKASRAGYKVDKQRSKIATKVAKLRKESEDDMSDDEESALDELIASIVSAVENGELELDEAEKKACEAEDEEKCPECGESPCVCDEPTNEADNNDDDTSADGQEDDGEVDEATIKHMTAAEKMKAKKYRASASGKKALMKYSKKSSRAGYKVDKQRSKTMKKIASLRRESVMEQLEEAFKDTEVFKTLNESEVESVSNILKESINNFLSEAEMKIVESLVEDTETYVNEEVIPEMQSYIDESVIPEIRMSLEEDISNYLTHIIEEWMEEHGSTVVESADAKQNKEFIDKLTVLMAEELRIIPERIDALVEAEEKIEELNEKIDLRVQDVVRLKAQLRESERLNLAYSLIPAAATDSQREKIVEAVKELEGVKKEQLEEAVQEIVNRTLNIVNESKKKSDEKKEPINESKDEYADLINRAVQFSTTGRL